MPVNGVVCRQGGGQMRVCRGRCCALHGEREAGSRMNVPNPPPLWATTGLRGGEIVISAPGGITQNSEPSQT